MEKHGVNSQILWWVSSALTSPRDAYAFCASSVLDYKEDSCPICGKEDDYIRGSCGSCWHTIPWFADQEFFHNTSLQEALFSDRASQKQQKNTKVFRRDFNIEWWYSIFDPRNGWDWMQKKYIDVMVESLKQVEEWTHVVFCFQHHCQVRDNTCKTSKKRQRYLWKGKRISQSFSCTFSQQWFHLFAWKTSKAREIRPDEKAYYLIGSQVWIPERIFQENMRDYYLRFSEAS